MTEYVTVPGIGGSDAAHWQTRWESLLAPRVRRIAPASWDAPELTDWVQAIDEAVGVADDEVVLVAHSLGCWAVAEWCQGLGVGRPARALLVAPPNPEGPRFPSVEAESFVGLAATPLGIPGLVVASRDDPYCEPRKSRELAAQWEADWADSGAKGHLNSDSGLGAWEAGRTLLTRLEVA